MHEIIKSLVTPEFDDLGSKQLRTGQQCGLKNGAKRPFTELPARTEQLRVRALPLKVGRKGRQRAQAGPWLVREALGVEAHPALHVHRQQSGRIGPRNDRRPRGRRARRRERRHRRRAAAGGERMARGLDGIGKRLSRPSLPFLEQFFELHGRGKEKIQRAKTVLWSVFFIVFQVHCWENNQQKKKKKMERKAGSSVESIYKMKER